MWKAITVEPIKKADACFIMLHGLGATGEDFSSIAFELQDCRNTLRCIFPHAPLRPVTLNGGMVMPAWYDIFALKADAKQDIEGIYQSQRILNAIIDQQIKEGIPSERIILAGFSQGGALALHTALRYPQRLGGVLGLSTYLPLMDRVEKEYAPSNRGLPIVLYHGTSDPVLPLPMAQGSYQILRRLGITFDWVIYPMAHTVHPAQMAHAQAWIQRILC